MCTEMTYDYCEEKEIYDFSLSFFLAKEAVKTVHMFYLCKREGM